MVTSAGTSFSPRAVYSPANPPPMMTMWGIAARSVAVNRCPAPNVSVAYAIETRHRAGPLRADRLRARGGVGLVHDSGWEGDLPLLCEVDSSAMNVTVEEIKRDPEGVLHRVIEGETLVVTERDRPIAEIRPIEAARRPRPFGLARGELV